MDIESLFTLLWNITVVVALLAFALGFIFMATRRGEGEGS